jgi:hypothetical protein
MKHPEKSSHFSLILTRDMQCFFQVISTRYHTPKKAKKMSKKHKKSSQKMAVFSGIFFLVIAEKPCLQPESSKI